MPEVHVHHHLKWSCCYKKCRDWDVVDDSRGAFTTVGHPTQVGLNVEVALDFTVRKDLETGWLAASCRLALVPGTPGSNV